MVNTVDGIDAAHTRMSLPRVCEFHLVCLFCGKQSTYFLFSAARPTSDVLLRGHAFRLILYRAFCVLCMRCVPQLLHDCAATSVLYRFERFPVPFTPDVLFQQAGFCR
jgi:hypothetical protein